VIVVHIYFKTALVSNVIFLVEDLLSKVKAKFNIIEDAESDGLRLYERELSVTQQVHLQQKNQLESKVFKNKLSLKKY
jgi:hypothetical protein